MYQEVKSQDGLSVLQDKIGLENYDCKSVLEKQMSQVESNPSEVEVEGKVGIFEEYFQVHHANIMGDYEEEKPIVTAYIAKQREEYLARRASITDEEYEKLLSHDDLCCHETHVHSHERCATNNSYNDWHRYQRKTEQ